MRHEKEQKIYRAAKMDKVPLVQLDKLIKERRKYALENNYEIVESKNHLIKNILGL